MAVIFLTNLVDAPPERVFDLSRSIDLHIVSTPGSNEMAIAGVTKGLIGPGQTVTWQAFHLFKLRKFTSEITAYERPFYFKDEMLKGDFKKFSHEHYFKTVNGKTEMSDKIILESPFGVMGKIFNRLYLKNYIEKFLKTRNEVIKKYAETDEWKMILIGKNG